MMQSMTGYAKAEVFYNNSTYLIELKSLNSKKIYYLYQIIKHILQGL